MWRTIQVLLPLLLLSSLSFAQEKGFECRTCEDDCEAQGLAPGERVCVVEGSSDDEQSAQDEQAQDNEQTPAQETPRAFESGLVHWQFIPVIEAINADGSVSPLDVQRTVAADEEAIRDCFIPLTYPGEGALDVEVHLAYNGVPTAVNGSPIGIAPDQARCILRRAWGYEFPRIAEEADKPARVYYRVSFIPQRMGQPEVDPQTPQLLLERVTTAQTQLQPQLAQELFAQLPSIERCAAQNLREIPHDLVVSEITMQWYRSGEGFMPSDVDLTVTNQTGTRRPSQPVLDCLTAALTTWDLDLPDAPPELQTIESTFFITTRPAGWYGS